MKQKSAAKLTTVSSGRSTRKNNRPLTNARKNTTPTQESQKEEKKINIVLVLQHRVKARKLARSILRRWRARLELDEIDSLVDISLCEATRHFNPSKGASFMTFMYYHLRGNLIRAVSAAANANVIPIEDIRVDEELEEGGSRSDLECCVSAADVVEALSGNENYLPDEAFLKKEIVDLSRCACSKLDSLEREVIERIYIEGEQLMDVAAELGYSRCHISRVKRKALEALYENLSTYFDPEELPAKPEYGNDEEMEPRRVSLSERKRVYRRRPRSQVTKRFHNAAIGM